MCGTVYTRQNVSIMYEMKPVKRSIQAIKPKVIAIDFDGVIHDKDHPVKGKRMGPPMVGAGESVRLLRKRGYKIIVHTCMAVTPGGKQTVADWLDYYDIPCKEVTATKPIADLYIDDKALRFEDWADTLNYLGVKQ
jgi:hypothetical protein